MNVKSPALLALAGSAALIAGCSSTTTTVVRVPAPIRTTVTATPSPARTTVTATPTAAPSRSSAPPPQVVINNNAAPAPAQTVYEPAPAVTYPAYSGPDPFSVVDAYLTDVSTPGSIPAAWALLSYSEQGGWNHDYSSYYDWASPVYFTGITEDSESGDSVTVTYTQNGDESATSYTVTFVVDGGIIQSDDWSQVYG